MCHITDMKAENIVMINDQLCIKTKMLRYSSENDKNPKHPKGLIIHSRHCICTSILTGSSRKEHPCLPLTSICKLQLKRWSSGLA